MSVKIAPACAWALALAAVLSTGAAMAQGDPAKGEKVFNKCKVCHSLEAGKNRIGPSLAGLIGRKAGTVEGFKYSEAMAGSDVVWDEQTLDAYLLDTKGFIPGNRMAFPGVKKDEDRADLIEYLKQAAQ